ncbi:prolipoprotein diacylglyceryl transferase [Candidatus Binatia bacterium]|nr:prolipoprotein diacylglyceryl transferase [Candidatus Binatia bacterium]
MYPVILQLGPVTIYSYGLMMALGFLTAGYLTGREMNRHGLNGELASAMVFWAAVGGLVGARLLAIGDEWSSFVADPVGFMLSGSGFVFFGGLIGGFIAVSLTILRHGLPWAVTVDCIAPGLVLAQALGRIGCQLAGDGDWGRETTLPWGMAYPNAIVGWDYPPGVRVHPAPIYETLAYSAVFLILWRMRTRPHAPGNLFWWYLVLASGARFAIEFVRINPRLLFGLSEAQLIALGLMAIGAWRLLAARTVPAPAPGSVRSAKS